MLDTFMYCFLSLNSSNSPLVFDLNRQMLGYIRETLKKHLNETVINLAMLREVRRIHRAW